MLASASLSAFSIIGLTMFHCRPPLPHPSGGIAILFILYLLIANASSLRPSVIYSYFDGYLQCCLVGKFIMIFSCPLLFFSRIINSLPIVSSPDLHASTYLVKLMGYAFLNCRAMPLPITPTVFTVLTRASALDSRRLPCVYLIMMSSI